MSGDSTALALIDSSPSLGEVLRSGKSAHSLVMPRSDESAHVQQSGITLKRAPKTSVRTADTLVDILVEAGVEVIFGLPGGPIAPIHDALIDRPEIRTITTRHEAGAVFAAAGYAQATGKLGVVVVTSGPGILNTMTGLASAYCDGLPVLILAGEVPRERFGQGAVQEGTSEGLDIIHMVRSITKFAAEARDPNTAGAVLRRAIATCLGGRRGPSVVTLPMDVGLAHARAAMIEISSKLEFVSRPETFATTANALADSQHGVLLVGSGARWGKGPELVRELAERLQMPVMTTPKAKGVFPENHPLSLGVYGWGGHTSASEYLTKGVDVIMAIGTSLGESSTDSWSKKLAPADHFIQLDVEAQRIGRNYPITLGLVDTVEGALPQIIKCLDKGAKRPRAVKKFGVRREDTGDKVLVGPEGRIAPQRALWELQQALPKTTLFTTDIGSHMFFALHHLEIRAARGFMIMLGLGSMGSGIGASVGVKVGRPDVPVVSICGDGCFSMGLGDVATAAQEGIPMIFAVLNDERYGMVEVGNDIVYGRSPTFSVPMSISQLAEGVGARAVVIEKPDDILKLDLLALSADGPLVLDIRIDRGIQLKSERLEFLREMVKAKRASANATEVQS